MPHLEDRTDDLSMLLVKPDGYRSREMRRHLDDLLSASGLHIVRRYPIGLTDDDILDIWPKFAGPKYPITAELLRLYMTSGVCEAIVVCGSDVVAQCVEIRGKIRGRFGTSAFGNCVHTPAETFEIAPNVEKFLFSLPTGQPFTRHHDEGTTEGIFGRLAAEPVNVLHAAARRFWVRQQTHGWRAAWRPRPAGGSYGAYLLPGDPHSIDYGMSLLADVLPTWTPGDVIAAYIEAEVDGSACLLAGDEPETRELAEHLTTHGLYTEVRPVPRPTGSSHGAGTHHH